ncbi:PH domain-containing protein [Micromonospora chaiyaphumensis]|uniref:PH domain-containing protein n=1 Tax=Micromonospora chaiyaphumensis TaxID=307119 RepID=A0A1C4Z4E0_9ACTN|nr:PH domain-containing protein [Micromonospora chaiyaphumensis]SCF27747.1 PH domain-containing protein [Micromonospora chaiyaphumensis]
MELHRNRGVLPLALVCVAGGVMVLAVAGDGPVLRMLVALGIVVVGATVLVGALRPFRCVLGPEGLEVRRPGLRGTYRWEQFAALALDDAGRLVGVPGPGLPPGPRLTARHPRDGRPAVELLDLGQVRESPDEVTAALARFAGDRFTDARTPSAGPDEDANTDREATA